MPNEFLGLELCPLFQLVCTQMLILVMFFKEENYIQKDQKTIILNKNIAAE